MTPALPSGVKRSSAEDIIRGFETPSDRRRRRQHGRNGTLVKSTDAVRAIFAGEQDVIAPEPGI